jgi:hypothetical protein
MKFSVQFSVQFSVLGWSVPLTALIALAGVSCPAEGIVDSGIIGGLADIGDMEPVTGVDAWERGDATAATVADTVKSGIRASVRQSVPARDRAASYRDGELFRNSKVALPLLVADLEPRMIAVTQPMSGRSVGARPAAAWTRPGRAPIAASASAVRESAAWASGR